MLMSELKDKVLELGRTGACGSSNDFLSWLRDSGIIVEPVILHSALESLESESKIRKKTVAPYDYVMQEDLQFSNYISYSVSSEKKMSPVQLVRSRLDAFLRYNNVTEVKIIDIIVATTEALENAVKYSMPDSRILINYTINDIFFNIQITNRVFPRDVIEDIRNGKYGEDSKTLMRGMLVMQKLFTTMDLNYDEENNIVDFKATLNL